jgi:hypothetical protein
MMRTIAFAMRERRAWGLAAGAVLALGVASLSVSFGQPEAALKNVPPDAKSPPPTALVELVVPAGVKVAMAGTKLTQDSKTGERVAEGEATVRLPGRVLLKTHQARVTVSKPVRNRPTRVTIVPMPTTVATR